MFHSTPDYLEALFSSWTCISEKFVVSVMNKAPVPELGHNTVFMMPKCTKASWIPHMTQAANAVWVWLVKAVLACGQKCSKVAITTSMGSESVCGTSVCFSASFSLSKAVMGQVSSLTSCSSKNTPGSVMHLAIGENKVQVNTTTGP